MGQSTHILAMARPATRSLRQQCAGGTIDVTLPRREAMSRLINPDYLDLIVESYCSLAVLRP